MKIKVEPGKYKVGDEIEGKKIKSFGKCWSEKIAGYQNFQGQLWEECKCGQEPVYLPHVLCEKCINGRYGNAQQRCYAYFE